MIAAVLLAGLVQAAPAAQAAQPQQVAVETAIGFCERVIAQPATAVPDAWDAFMDTDAGGSRIKPLSDVPELVRTVADQFAAGDRIKALLRARSSAGDVWIGTVIRSPRCLVVVSNDKLGPASFADFVLGFGSIRDGWKPYSASPGSTGTRWVKPVAGEGAPGTLLAGYPVGAKQLGYFLLMFGAPVPGQAPAP